MKTNTYFVFYLHASSYSSSLELLLTWWQEEQDWGTDRAAHQATQHLCWREKGYAQVLEVPPPVTGWLWSEWGAHRPPALSCSSSMRSATVSPHPHHIVTSPPNARDTGFAAVRGTYLCSVSSMFLWTGCQEGWTLLPRWWHLQQRTWRVHWYLGSQSHNRLRWRLVGS